MIIARLIKNIKRRSFNKKNVKIGKNSRILTKVNNFGTEPYLVEIGENCLITSNVKFLTHDGSVSVAYKYKKQMDLPKVYGKYNKFGRIIVEDNVFIGINSIIMPGVTIGKNSVIGAGSIVTKDVPSCSVYAGIPAKYICSIDEYCEKVFENEIYVDEDNLETRKEKILGCMSILDLKTNMD